MTFASLLLPHLPGCGSGKGSSAQLLLPLHLSPHPPNLDTQVFVLRSLSDRDAPPHHHTESWERASQTFWFVSPIFFAPKHHLQRPTPRRSDLLPSFRCLCPVPCLLSISLGLNLLTCLKVDFRHVVWSHSKMPGTSTKSRDFVLHGLKAQRSSIRFYNSECMMCIYVCVHTCGCVFMRICVCACRNSPAMVHTGGQRTVSGVSFYLPSGLR